LRPKKERRYREHVPRTVEWIERASFCKRLSGELRRVPLSNRPAKSTALPNLKRKATDMADADADRRDRIARLKAISSNWPKA
jgi:hypothetical protein